MTFNNDSVIPSGKMAGKKVRDLPNAFKAWALRLPDAKGWVLELQQFLQLSRGQPTPPASPPNGQSGPIRANNFNARTHRYNSGTGSFIRALARTDRSFAQEDPPKPGTFLHDLPCIPRAVAEAAIVLNAELHGMPKGVTNTYTNCSCPGRNPYCIHLRKQGQKIEGRHAIISVSPAVPAEMIYDPEGPPFWYRGEPAKRVLQTCSEGESGDSAMGHEGLEHFETHPTATVNYIPISYMLLLTLDEWKQVKGVGEDGCPSAEECFTLVAQAASRV